MADFNHLVAELYADQFEQWANRVASETYATASTQSGITLTGDHLGHYIDTVRVGAMGALLYAHDTGAIDTDTFIRIITSGGDG